MTQEPHLDDRYTTGVYYDRHAGEYCEIVELDETIGLCEPGRDEPYFTYDELGATKEQAIESVNKDMTEVSEQVVDNPVHVVERAIRMHQRNSINELASVPEQEAIDLGYARSQVEIVEK